MSLERQAHWPVLAVWLVVLLLMPMQEQVVYERAWLQGAGFLFVALAAFFAAVWMGGSFVRNGSPGMLLLSCGAFFWGTAGSIAVLSIFLGNDAPALINANTLPTLHNACAWLAAITQLAGAAISCNRMEPVARPRAWMIVACLAAAAILALLVTASSHHWTPLFFRPGEGVTVTRFPVLGSAIAMLLLAALLLCLAGRPSTPPFIRWYSLALVLMAVGLAGLLQPKAAGALASWAASSAHYCSALCMLAAVFRSWPGFGPETVSTLRESQTLLHSMTESTSDSVYIKDWAGRYLMCNGATCRYFGKPAAEVLGKDDRAFLAPEEANEIMARDRDTLASGEVWTGEESIILASQAYTFLSTKGPVRSPSGAIIGLFGISRDITNRKRMEEELQQSRAAAVADNLAKTRLLSTAAHEFRTPLSLLQSSLDILDRYGDQLDVEERKTRKRHIRSAIQQLTDLAESLLTYRKVEGETGRKVEAVFCDIEMLSRAVAEETQAAKGEGHEFLVTIGEECGLLLIDPVLYRRVLVNLLVNAFQYTPPGRQVSLEVVKASDRLRVTVADQGIGIEQGDLGRIFDPFFRGGNVGQRRGNGLGLPIIHESLARMDGKISIASTPGQGTRFEISLPWRELDDEEDEPLEDAPGE